MDEPSTIPDDVRCTFDVLIPGSQMMTRDALRVISRLCAGEWDGARPISAATSGGVEWPTEENRVSEGYLSSPWDGAGRVRQVKFNFRTWINDATTSRNWVSWKRNVYPNYTLRTSSGNVMRVTAVRSSSRTEPVPFSMMAALRGAFIDEGFVATPITVEVLQEVLQ